MDERSVIHHRALVREPRSNAVVAVVRACKPNGGRRFAFAVASLRRTPLPPLMSALRLLQSVAIFSASRKKTTQKYLTGMHHIGDCTLGQENSFVI